MRKKKLIDLDAVIKLMIEFKLVADFEEGMQAVTQRGVVWHKNIPIASPSGNTFNRWAEVYDRVEVMKGIEMAKEGAQ